MNIKFSRSKPGQQVFELISLFILFAHYRKYFEMKNTDQCLSKTPIDHSIPSATLGNSDRTTCDNNLNIDRLFEFLLNVPMNNKFKTADLLKLLLAIFLFVVCFYMLGSKLGFGQWFVFGAIALTQFLILISGILLFLKGQRKSATILFLFFLVCIVCIFWFGDLILKVERELNPSSMDAVESH